MHDYGTDTTIAKYGVGLDTNEVKERLKAAGAVWDKEVDEHWIVEGNLNFSGLGLTRLPPIGWVEGNFDCSWNRLSSLAGPLYIGGQFDCSYNQLTSLKHGPKEVKGTYNCRNNSLFTLEGAPIEHRNNFYCDYNVLTSLEYLPYFPEEGNVSATCNCMDLQYCRAFSKVFQPGGHRHLCLLHQSPPDYGDSPDPEQVKARLEDQEALWTYKGWVIKDYVDLTNLGLTRLPTFAPTAEGNFICDHNLLENLQGSPAVVNGDFSCTFNCLSSWYGVPFRIKGDLRCDYNHLKNLKGMPTKINGTFSCSNNLAPLEDEFVLKGIKKDIENFKFQHGYIGTYYGRHRSFTYDDLKEPLENLKVSNKSNKAQKEPLVSKENLCGALHPSKVNWDSIETTGSRGFPIWDGVPKENLREKILKDNIKESCETASDQIGPVENIWNRKGFFRLNNRSIRTCRVFCSKENTRVGRPRSKETDDERK